MKTVKPAAKTMNQDGGKGRRTLQTLQHAAGDKENLVGTGRDPKSKEEETINEKVVEKNIKNSGKMKWTVTRGVQTEKERIAIKIEDLISEAGPSENYWQSLAERRRVALEETLKENKELHEELALLKTELATYKELLETSKELIASFSEALDDSGHETADESTVAEKTDE